MNYNPKDIDLELEKIVFLWDAKEENSGIYELIWELSYYDISIEDKYWVAHTVLKGMVYDGLVTLEKYSNILHKSKICTIPYEKSEEVLNNPLSWYPEKEVISITLTEKGQEYLDNSRYQDSPKLNERFNYKKQ